MEREKILLRIPNDLKCRLKELAKTKGLTVNGFIVKILWDYIQNKRREHGNKEEKTKKSKKKERKVNVIVTFTPGYEQRYTMACLNALRRREERERLRILEECKEELKQKEAS